MEKFIKWILLTLVVSIPISQLIRYYIKQFNLVKPYKKIGFVYIYIALVIGLATVSDNQVEFAAILAIGFIVLLFILLYLFVPINKNTFQQFFNIDSSKLIIKNKKFWLLIILVIITNIFLAVISSKVYLIRLIFLLSVILIIVVSYYIQKSKR